jgi:thiamine pyrophosphokinase
VGGFGGRIDHTLGNLQAMRYAADRAARVEMNDGESWATIVEGGSVRVSPDAIGGGPVKLSVFALDRICEGVNIRGTKWEIEDGVLNNGFPIGVSNEFAGEYAEISVRKGALLVTLCREYDGE